MQYKGISEEHKAVRAAAGLFDTSHMGELLLSGEHAAQVVNYLITNDASRLVDGQALYTCACNEAGTILDDLIVYRIEATKWLIVCNAANRDKIAAHFKKAAENHCEFEDTSDRTAMIALQGRRRSPSPRSPAATGPTSPSCRASISATPSSPTCSAPWRAPATPAKTAWRSSARRSTRPRCGAR